MEREGYEEYRKALGQKLEGWGFRMVRWPKRNVEVGNGKHVCGVYWSGDGVDSTIEDLLREEFEMDLTVGAFVQEDYIKFRRAITK